MRVQQSGVLEKVARIEAEPKERADGTTSGPRESGNASRELEAAERERRAVRT